jgi:hypothetical protein
MARQGPPQHIPTSAVSHVSTNSDRKDLNARIARVHVIEQVNAWCQAPALEIE